MVSMTNKVFENESMNEGNKNVVDDETLDDIDKIIGNSVEIDELLKYVKLTFQQLQ